MILCQVAMQRPVQVGIILILAGHDFRLRHIVWANIVELLKVFLDVLGEGRLCADTAADCKSFHVQHGLEVEYLHGNFSCVTIEAFYR